MGFFDFLDSNNHVLAKIDSNGKLLDRNNHVLGRITWSGEVQDANNHTLGAGIRQLSRLTGVSFGVIQKLAK